MVRSGASEHHDPDQIDGSGVCPAHITAVPGRIVQLGVATGTCSMSCIPTEQGSALKSLDEVILSTLVG
jgi:hypothetical protein